MVVDKNKEMETPTPPDGGWGWVIVFGSCVLLFINGSVTTVFFGMSISDIAKDFSVSRSEASWIGSIHLCAAYGLGPLASIFLNKFGCIGAAITGALVLAAGFALSYFANSVIYLCATMGLIGGTGISIMCLPAVVSVATYFKEKRSLATGLAFCGTGLGTLVMAPVFNFLITNYHWRLAVLAVSGLALCGTLVGFLFRPLPIVTQGSAVSTSEHEGQLEEIKHSTQNERMFYTQDRMPSSTPELASSLEPNMKTGSTLAHVQPACTSLRSDPEKQFLVTKLKQEDIKSGFLRSWTGFSLLKNPIFVMVATSNFLAFLGYFVPYVYIVDLARTNLGLSDKDPSVGWLVSSIGIANTASRVFMGYLSDRKWANRIYIYSSVLGLCGLVITVIPLIKSLKWLFACATVFGACSGTYFSSTSVVLVDLFGLERLSDAFGNVLLFQGAGALLGPPIVGALYDTYRDYLYGFIFGGACMGTSSMLMFLVALIHRSQIYR